MGAGLLVDTGVEVGVADTVLVLVVGGTGTPPPEPVPHDATGPPGAVYVKVLNPLYTLGM